MSSIYERVVVDFVQSLGSPSSSGVVGTSNPPDKASRKEILARINVEETILSEEGHPWYEIKALLLQESDKALIRDLSGMSDQYEVLIPLPKDRAHLPPEGYHTFYMNQLEMGLRFPVPRFIQDLCDHLTVSPSQLTQNSYSSLLGLGVLLKVYQAPLSLHLIDKLTQIRQQDVGKFFIRIAWYCDMSWSEKPTKRVLPPPAQEYDPVPFLKDACTKCYNARDLVREDLLCHFGFSRKGVAVEGDLADRIMKSYLLEAFKKQGSETSRGSNPRTEEQANHIPEKPVSSLPEEPANLPPAERTKEKRRKSSSGSEKLSKRKKASPSIEIDEEAGTSRPEQSSLEEEMKKAGEEAEEKIKKVQEEAETAWEKKKEDFLKSDEFDRLSATRALSFFQKGFDGCLAQIRDNGSLPVVNSASDKKITEALASNFLQVLLWGGELSRRVTKARETARSSRRSLEDVMVKHDKLMKEIEDEEMKKAGEEAEEKIKKVQEEAETAWEKKKEDFLKSDEFDRLCATRALSFFQKGFDGCLAQIRDNGYSEAEYPFSFLDVLKSLEALPDDGEAESSGAKK
ncbi:hypothetical protein F511_13129 [Dorcoceras hygrometricum]|uniref:Uncharacterized protein n=1 Tax=Dorcoceras hygrometricum TaxID=472368 RepID=A0A2Z7D0C2_9LAMI|nr:hypothetical protein F511_13129 [Dorcoceras hygrometricum]